MLAYRSVDRSRLGGFRELVDGRSWWVRRVENAIRLLCVLDDGEGDEFLSRHGPRRVLFEIAHGF